jgi:hypothetical protein
VLESDEEDKQQTKKRQKTGETTEKKEVGAYSKEAVSESEEEYQSKEQMIKKYSEP